MTEQRRGQGLDWHKNRRRFGLALLAVIGGVLGGCGSTTSTAATITITGPALLYFYTDG